MKTQHTHTDPHCSNNENKTQKHRHTQPQTKFSFANNGILNTISGHNDENNYRTKKKIIIKGIQANVHIQNCKWKFI